MDGGITMPRALVVDDSRAMRMILSRTLTESGFEVVQAANGREALEIMEREGASIGLVLLDWNMPEITGIEVLEKLRSQSAFNGVRLVMVTTETEIEQMARALEAGADEYVMKPFTREAVEDKLRLIGVLA
jgi:two-component system chemotaxis response regulator CheY